MRSQPMQHTAAEPRSAKTALALARLLSGGPTDSIEVLAARLGVSPDMIIQDISTLEAQGVRVLNEGGAAYRLAAPLDLLDSERLRSELAQRAPGLAIEILDECDSTSTLLASRQETTPSGAVVACEYQRAGRGRRGHRWASGIAASLTFSILWRFEGGSAALSGLSLAVAVTVATALERQGLGGITLKWPNDLLHCGRKFGGILIEVSGSPQGPSTAIIGIGLNVRLPAEVSGEIDRPVTDLAGVAGAVGAGPEAFILPDRNTLLTGVLTGLGATLPRYELDGFAAFRADWMARHAHQGQRVCLAQDNRTVAEGVADGVAADGALLLRTAHGVERFHSGDVSLRAASMGT